MSPSSEGNICHILKWQPLLFITYALTAKKRKAKKKLFFWRTSGDVQGWRSLNHSRSCSPPFASAAAEKAFIFCRRRPSVKQFPFIESEDFFRKLFLIVTESVHSIRVVQKIKKWSPNVGLEPTTLRLRVSCSTDWASRAVSTESANLLGFEPVTLQFYFAEKMFLKLFKCILCKN